jgi:hypothetical protein
MPDSDQGAKKLKQRPLLERSDLTPKERARIGRAVGWLLVSGLSSITALGSLAIWHLIRRGRLLRESLANPKKIELPDLDITHRDPTP